MTDDFRTLRPLNSNLLYALHAILEAPTLTAASLMMARSQPAMSMALRRLRDHFDDELVLYGHPRRLSALGEALRPRVARLLREIEDTFNLSLDFEPATAHCVVTLTAPEPIELMYLSRVVPRLMREAPNVEVRLLPFTYGSTERLFDRGVDVAVVPESMVAPTLASRTLFDHDLTGLVWRDHPIGDTVTAAGYANARHVALFEEIERALFADRRDDPLLMRRRVVARTGHYAMLPQLVIGTDLIASTSSWLAQYYASIMPVRLVSLPIERRPAQLVAQWQPHRSQEPLINWILGLLVGALDWPRGDKWR